MHDIRSFLPELFTQPGTLLYIGARPDAHSWLPELAEAGNWISVLEIWPENAKGLFEDSRIKGQIIIGDVRDIQAYPGEESFWQEQIDYIFWWHGPEHINKEEIAPTLAKLEARARKLIVLACSWGYYPEKEYKGNPYGVGQCHLYPSDFKALGYQVRMDGNADQAGGEIVAWKKAGR